eukprot:TRINITY_DN3939_c0_g1_i2.p1 TRINITY_DN3939_c0_g1~~TRINITY_DN3939_c0_g1_i2.p1  ORF type:complete len:483 (+),score=67.94 TRINITY_DN3939_c0_g1_i2:70-1449(+)
MSHGSCQVNYLAPSTEGSQFWGSWSANPDESYAVAPHRRRPHQGERECKARSKRNHACVPRRRQLENQSVDLPTDKLTTVMIRNVPNNFNRQQLMGELSKLGFGDSYDFLYLPIDSATSWNVGYAFVNFESPESAAACIATMGSYWFPHPTSGKKRAVLVSYAHVQGLKDNVAHCKRTSLFCNGDSSQRPWVKKSQSNASEDGEVAKAEPTMRAVQSKLPALSSVSNRGRSKPTELFSESQAVLTKNLKLVQDVKYGEGVSDGAISIARSAPAASSATVVPLPQMFVHINSAFSSWQTDATVCAPASVGAFSDGGASTWGSIGCGVSVSSFGVANCSCMTSEMLRTRSCGTPEVERRRNSENMCETPLLDADDVLPEAGSTLAIEDTGRQVGNNCGLAPLACEVHLDEERRVLRDAFRRVDIPYVVRSRSVASAEFAEMSIPSFIVSRTPSPSPERRFW